MVTFVPPPLRPVAGVTPVGFGGATTVIVPCMKEWIEQWYGKTPACVKVKENVPPGAMGAESQTGVGVASLVVVWLSPPIFVQVTRVPTGTVKTLAPPGPWKANSEIETATSGGAVVAWPTVTRPASTSAKMSAIPIRCRPIPRPMERIAATLPF